MADWPYQYSPYIWPMLASTVLHWTLGFYGWRHRSTPGAVSFVFLLLCGGLWALCGALQVASTTLDARFLWFKIQSFPTLLAGIAAFFFAVEYTGRGKWLTRRTVAAFLSPTLLFLLHFVDNSRLAYNRYWWDGQIRVELAPLSAAVNLYGLGLIIVASVLFIILFVRSPQHRVPVAIILCGHLVTRVVYVLKILNALPSSPLDQAVLAFDVTAVTYAIALFRFRLFDVVPVARDSAVERMADAVIVLDAGSRVADLNLAALALLGRRRSQTLGCDASQALAAVSGLAAYADRQAPAEGEVATGEGTGRRWYRVNASPLSDGRGFLLGRLLVLHETTQLRLAQERLLQQERAVAALREREQLARDLHDGVGQVLAYVSLQVEASRKLLDDGKTAVADTQLARLAAVARDAHADVREYILSLRATMSDQRPFLAALELYLDDYAQNYGVRTGLSVAPGFVENELDPEAQVHVFRIVQEALTNARKHGGAKNVDVAISAANRVARIVVQDDGGGFDPAERRGTGLGLQLIRERAEIVKGRVEIDSAPGEGTRVAVCVPLSSSASIDGAVKVTAPLPEQPKQEAGNYEGVAGR